MLQRRYLFVISACKIAICLFVICLNNSRVYAQEGEAVARRARRFEPYIIDAAERYGVNPQLLWVIAYLETRFDPDRKSRKGARGLMQFMPLTALRYGLSNPFDPIAAIDAAARYVRDLAIRFDNRADLVLAAYNSGETTVEAYLMGRAIKAGSRIINPKGLITGGIPPYRETREYVSRGLRLLKNFREKTRLQVASAKDNLEFKEERSQLRSLVRKSIRASSDFVTIGAEQQVTGGSRLSIYFGDGHKKD
jgi:soluble lytic murein transglycosylase-like protein